MHTEEEARVPAYKRTCSIAGCDALVGPKGAKGLCNAHYKRLRAGRPLDVPVQERGAGWVSSHGYRYVGKKAQHRLVMEDILGRELSYNEIVHHKDGNPLNNAPDNLEVMQRGEHIALHCAGKTNEQRAAEKREHGYVLAGKPT